MLGKKILGRSFIYSGFCALSRYPASAFVSTSSIFPFFCASMLIASTFSSLFFMIWYVSRLKSFLSNSSMGTSKKLDKQSRVSKLGSVLPRSYSAKVDLPACSTSASCCCDRFFLCLRYLILLAKYIICGIVFTNVKTFFYTNGEKNDKKRRIFRPCLSEQ